MFNDYYKMIIDQKVKGKIIGVYLIDGYVDGGQLATLREPTPFQKWVVEKILGWVWVSILTLKENENS